MARIDKYDWTTGRVDLSGGAAQVSGSRLTFNTTYCHGTLAALEGSWSFEGMVICAAGSNKFARKMRVTIR
jgi:hypothetical protein